MAFLDVMPLGDQLVVDCQSDLLSHLSTRFVVPLRDRRSFTAIKSRLNPVFPISGTEYVLLTEFASAVRLRDLGKPVAALEQHREAVIAALDVLITGI